MRIELDADSYFPLNIFDFQVNVERKIAVNLLCLYLLGKEIEFVSRLLPEDALLKLRSSTPVWVNENHFDHGSFWNRNPNVIGHYVLTSSQYFRSGGIQLLPCKDLILRADRIIILSDIIDVGLCGRGEISVDTMLVAYDTYTEQVGSVFLHEMAHSFHDKFVIDGFSNKAIKVAYERAMQKCLYDRVPGTCSPSDKVYAAKNDSEFFAELSVAFFLRTNAFNAIQHRIPTQPLPTGAARLGKLRGGGQGVGPLWCRMLVHQLPNVVLG